MPLPVNQPGNFPEPQKSSAKNFQLPDFDDEDDFEPSSQANEVSEQINTSLPDISSHGAHAVENGQTVESTETDDSILPTSFDNDKLLNNRRGQNRFDSVDDDSFSPIEDQAEIDEDDSDVVPEEEPEDVEETKPAPKKHSKFARRRGATAIAKTGDKEKKEPNSKGMVKKPVVVQDEQNDYIDTKTGKLLPFGSRKQKKAAEAELAADPRRDLARSSKYVTYGILGGVGILALLGVKSAVVQPNIPDDTHIAAVAVDAVGDKGFPLDRGDAFVTGFMNTYLNVPQNSTANDTSLTNTLLGYYYTGQMGTGAEIDSRSIGKNYSQKVLLGPIVYDRVAVSDYSARYTVGAVVEPVNAPSDGSAAKWSFFNVNVYYDSTADSLSIVPDSPTVIAPVNVASSQNVPAEQAPGTGNADDNLTQSVSSVVTGFVKAYAISSPTNHTALDQYITDSTSPALIQGLNGRYTVTDDGISATAYTTTDPNTVKVVVKVTWIDTQGGDSSTNYTSNYIMTLTQQSAGKYLVSKFAPEYYVIDPNANS